MKRYTQNQIEEMADILKKGGVISVPTDTVYGICACIGNPLSYNKLVMIKGRPGNKSFPIMCANKEQIKSIAIVDKKVEKLISCFMPGPITLVLNKKRELFYINNAGLRETSEMAIRMAPSKVLKELIEKVGCPIFMTSANHSGEPVFNNLDEIEKICPQLDGMMEGNVSFGRESTIIDCTENKIKIQRPGPIAIEEVTKVLQEEREI